MHNATTCPSWCARQHATSPLRVTHARQIAEFGTDAGLTVDVILFQYDEPGQIRPAAVRLITNTRTDTSVTDLDVEVAAHLGHVLTLMNRHPLGAALTTAAATLLGAAE
ncbi:hypothetical protein [Microbispora triticiradicis]|uniref:hypothetical protein n=1 Tax=Microbispora triticiradicis TaxID=2200763 RepID=UPI001AD66EED|nr:hypothetical protein [Microbispora triticiradicis]MBO4270414.1 hypothetical protein [Microbispora triticiradicis]